MVGQDQVKPVEAKVEAVGNFPTPTEKKDGMQFLGVLVITESFAVILQMLHFLSLGSLSSLVH